MSIDALFATAKMKCTCCGVPSIGADLSTCDCWNELTDRCTDERGFGCVNHCNCDTCKVMRGPGGLRRINWTGLRHLYWDGDTRTACGRKVPAKYSSVRVVRSPRDNDCSVCSKKTFGEKPKPEDVK